MPKKGGKAKAPAFLTDPDATAPFGFQVNDILLTPLGVEVTVLGVKPDSTGVHEAHHILRDGLIEKQKKQEQLAEIDWKATGVHLLQEEDS